MQNMEIRIGPLLVGALLLAPLGVFAQEEEPYPTEPSEPSEPSDPYEPAEPSEPSVDTDSSGEPEEPYVEEEYQPGPAAPVPAPVPTPPPPPPSAASTASIPSTPPAPPPPSPPPPGAKKPRPLNEDGTVAKDGQKKEDEDKDKKEDGPFAWFSVAPEVGLAIYPAADMMIKGIQFTINRRIGFVGKVHLDLGGAGLAVDLAPLIAVEGANVHLDASQGVGGGLGGDYVAFGGELSILYKFHAKSFFPHLGIGFHGTYLTSDALEYGSELFGRIPFGFTWYVAEDFGLVFEFGFMYGVTGIRWRFTEAMKRELLAELGLDENTPLPKNEDELKKFIDDNNLNNDAAAKEKLAQSIASKTLQFGDGFGFDFMIGVRFP